LQLNLIKLVFLELAPPHFTHVAIVQKSLLSADKPTIIVAKDLAAE
jgi:hypothetical protein